MKTAREILHEHYRRYGRSSEEGQILAMEEYKNQEKICKCEDPKILGDFNSCADARCDKCYGYITPLKNV